MYSALLDALFPRRSLAGTEGMWITDEERHSLRLTPVLLPTTTLRQRGLHAIDTVIAAGSYDDSPLLKKAILTFKYQRVRGLASDLASGMVTAIPGMLFAPKTFGDHSPVLCPVPLHWTRRFHRGFNQAQLLAERVGRAYDWPVEELLVRIRPTGHQAWRSKNERLTALVDAFAAKPDRRLPPFVILVDDLCTTGATLEECAKSLKKAGVRHVAAVVAAVG